MALAEDLIDAGAGARAQAQGVATAARTALRIVMLPSDDPAGDVRRLAEAGIVTDARPGHVRVSPYFYNVADDHRAAIERLTRD